MKLSVAIIVKNEEAMIRSCLESVKDADEIIVVDTGSEDRTAEIAREYTKKIRPNLWEEDFSKARNFSCSLCSGEWILSIDADEQLENGGIVNFIHRHYNYGIHPVISAISGKRSGEIPHQRFLALLR